MKKVVLVFLVMGSLMTGSCFAQKQAIDNLGFRLGDDVSAVKLALKTDMEAEPMASSSSLPGVPDLNKGKTFLHLRTKGIWVFLNPSNKAETVRLDAPYGYPVAGIKLGDDIRKITSTLGAPIKKPWTVFVNMQRYQFALDDSAYVSFDVNDDGVQYIFINK